jgi:hypothetical protein
MLATYFGAPSRAAFTVAGLALVWFWLLPLPSHYSSRAARAGATRCEGCSDRRRPLPKRINGSIEMFFRGGRGQPPPPRRSWWCSTPSWFLSAITLAGKVLGGVTPVRTAVAYPLLRGSAPG